MSRCRAIAESTGNSPDLITFFAATTASICTQFEILKMLGVLVIEEGYRKFQYLLMDVAIPQQARRLEMA